MMELNTTQSFYITTHAAFGLALIGIAWLVADYARMLYMRRSLPPGPFPWPIVGNHFQTPSVKPWITWEKWGEYYKSPMLTLWVGRDPRIIINDAWVASELLEKKADVFSSRPRMVLMGDAINATKTNQTTMTYGDRWRVHRKLMVSKLYIASPALFANLLVSIRRWDLRRFATTVHFKQTSRKY
jgi:hypothetical protein